MFQEPMSNSPIPDHKPPESVMVTVMPFVVRYHVDGHKADRHPVQHFL